MGGFTVPLIEVKHTDAKVDARHVMLAREDYVGDTGAPVIASCRTERGDGSNDLTAYAPTSIMTLDIPRPALNRAMRDIVVNADLAAMGARSHHKFHDTKLARMARVARRMQALMAWSTSNGNAYYLFALGTGVGKPGSGTPDAFKTALYGNAVVPAQSSTAALTQYNGAGSTWVTANEVTGTGYTAGGVAVAPVTWTQGTNVVTFTSSGSPQWTASSFTAYGCLVYDTTTTNQAISWNYFGGAQTVTSGTFSITWNASGILTLTC
jgi:hypothetical protein